MAIIHAMIAVMIAPTAALSAEFQSTVGIVNPDSPISIP
jgi:hypothetical protein